MPVLILDYQVHITHAFILMLFGRAYLVLTNQEVLGECISIRKTQLLLYVEARLQETFVQKVSFGLGP